MTGNELLEFLKNQAPDSLKQEVIFEVEVAPKPGHIISGHVPIIEARSVDGDHYYVPEYGLLSGKEALKNYNELKAEVTANDKSTLEDIERYQPFNCHKVLTEGQLVMKLQGLQGYHEPSAPGATPDPEEYSGLKISHWGVIGEA